MTSTIGYGVSDTLVGMFRALRETYGLNGLKFRGEDIDRLAIHIVCRHYHNLTLELCYLCWAVVNYDPATGDHPRKNRLFRYFEVDERFKPRQVRDFFDKPWQQDKMQIVMADEHLRLIFADGEFRMSPSRVSLLGALLELLLEIDKGLLQRLTTRLEGGQQRAVKLMALDLQKVLYQFLSHHLPEVQLQNKFHSMSTWLADRQEDHITLDNDSILQFWLQHCEDPDAGWVKFATVCQYWFNWLLAVSTVQARINNEFALSLDAAEEEGGVDPEKLHTILSDIYTSSTDFTALCRAPKCLKQQSVKTLEQIEIVSRRTRFLLTLLRQLVFSKWQNKLIQASKNNRESVTDRLTNPPEEHYRHFTAMLAPIKTEVQYALSCLYHVFANTGHLRAVAGYLTSEQSSETGQVSDFFQQALANQMQRKDPAGHSALINQARLQFPGFNAFLKQCKTACGNNSRDGFKPLPEVFALEPYENATEMLDSVVSLLNRMENAFDKFASTQDVEQIFSSDLCIFTDTLDKLHGEKHANQI